MKKLITVLMSLILLSGLAKISAQTPITVTVPPFGDKVKLQPLKTGSYQIGYALGNDGTQMLAPGKLYVINNEGSSLKIGIVLKLMPERKDMYVTSMNTIRGWMVADGDKYVTYDMEKGASNASVGYGTVWGYSKKYQALRIDAGGRNATVIYEPKSYQKMDEVKVLEKIYQIMDTPGAIDLIP